MGLFDENSKVKVIGGKITWIEDEDYTERLPKEEEKKEPSPRPLTFEEEDFFAFLLTFPHGG